jgi:hypothetical protein
MYKCTKWQTSVVLVNLAKFPQYEYGPFLGFNTNIFFSIT